LLTVVAATGFEAAAVRRAAPAVNLVCSGVGLSRASAQTYDTVLSCGLAGGLRRDVPTGAVVIPSEVMTDSGEQLVCDERMNDALIAAAVRLGYAPVRERLLTSAALVTGANRGVWAQRGFAAADMETGFLRARRLAALRVVLDTPQFELSEAWLRPLSVLGRPTVWPQALWLWRQAPQCARIMSAVLAQAMPRLAAIAADHPVSSGI
jgi:hypothetical protein